MSLISAKHKKTKKDLIEKIREEDIVIDLLEAYKKNQPYACYFCLNHIPSLGFILKEKQNKYYICPSCYKNARKK